MKRYGILLAIILLAFGLRVWQLPHIPPGLWYDEAYYSMDAVWLLDGGPWRLFFAGNNGREPIFIYLQALFIWLFGASPLTSRLIEPLAGTLTVALVYVLARRLAFGLKVNPSHPLPITNYQSTWLPYLAAAGLAISYWHLTLSRSGFRGILLPLVAIFVFYAFWRGWQENNWKWLALAGLALGVSQYTYLAARLLPLVLAFFVLAWTALNWRDSAQLKTLWLGLSLMALVAAAVFAPLGWLFYQNPALFSARTGDVLFTPDSPGELFQHLSDALRLFVDGGDPGWRHNLQGRPMLGWLGWLGFWPGLFICLRHPRRANHLFLAIALLTLYLPALFAVPPAHALRLSALLPIYYIIFALGLTVLVRLTSHVLRLTSPEARKRYASRLTPHVSHIIAVAVIAIMGLETGLTFCDYFYRWARAEETYVEFNGPLVDFVNEVITQTAQTAVIIPFQLYVHPTTRYLLHDPFTEQPAPTNLIGPAQLVTLPNDFQMLNVATTPGTPAWVWLDRDSSGKGVAYVSRPPRQEEQAYLNRVVETTAPEIYRDRFDRKLAHLRLLPDLSPLFPLFTDPVPERTISLTWADLVQLKGYDVLPPVIPPGQPLTLNFYWHSLTDETFDKRLFLQLIDPAGNPINQWEGEAFREDMYRWRPNGILPSQHTLWLGPDTPPGPYLVRLGFFDKTSGQRLPILKAEGGGMKDEVIPPSSFTGRVHPSAGGEDVIDQIQLGLFYVSPDGRDPRQPATPLSATFGDSIKLIGITLPEIHNSQFRIQSRRPPVGNSQLPVIFHWQPLHPTDKPYTLFLQLLDAQGKMVTSWDSQPFNGLYPTNLWSPGEIVVDTFSLPLPNEGLPLGAYRLITGFYDVATGQRLTVDSGGDFVELEEFVIE